VIVPGLLTVSLILGAFNGMRPFDWAAVTFISFMLFVSAVLRYRSGA
jgi:hypothetical protein